MTNEELKARNEQKWKERLARLNKEAMKINRKPLRPVKDKKLNVSEIDFVMF